MSDETTSPEQDGTAKQQQPETVEEWFASMTPLGKIEAAVDSVAARRNDVDEQLVAINTAEDWRRALTLIHATAKEWYSLRNRMMYAYLQLMRRAEKKETQ